MAHYSQQLSHAVQPVAARATIVSIFAISVARHDTAPRSDVTSYDHQAPGSAMAPNPQTLYLDVSSAEFARVTLAMMIHSNDMLKLQGFGVCLASWIGSCSHETFDLEIATRAILSFQSVSEKEAKIWVALAPENTAKLRELRNFLERRIDRPITLGATIFAVVEAFCSAYVQEKACSTPASISTNRRETAQSPVD